MNDRNNAPRTLRMSLARLREEFDSSFALPLHAANAQAGRMLCFAAGAVKFAIPMGDLLALSRCGSIAPVPSHSPGLLGLAVVRAQVVPVYSLPRLTGAGAQTGDCHWLALLRGGVPVALAIDALDGYAFESAAQSVAGETGFSFPPTWNTGLIRHNAELYATLRGAQIYDMITQGVSQEGKGNAT
ncbi:MAG TPA: chemotaxis protein CheW [Terracidiphilus sp.]|jgi:purine-binding chemotaxis protein CheW